MNKQEYNRRIKAFQSRYPNGGARGMRVPTEDRKEAVALVDGGKALGIKNEKTLKSIGFGSGCVRRWREEMEEGEELVRAIDEATKPTPTSEWKLLRDNLREDPRPKPVQVSTQRTTIKVTLPNGTKVSGLTVPEMIELLRGTS